MRFAKYLNEGVYDPAIFKAIFVAGGPGSGKSFVVGKATAGQGYKTVNSDDLFELMAKQKKISLSNMSAAGPEVAARDKIRNKAKELTLKRQGNLLKGRLGLIIDGTGRNYERIAKQKKALEEMGYDTYMIFVNTSLDVAKQRNLERARTVPEEIVVKSWQDVQNNMGKFQGLFGGTKFKIVDNSKYISDKNVFSDVWKDIMKFTKKPIENFRAKTWIETELMRRNALKAKKPM